MKELNVCENGETTTELHPITIRAVKAEEISEVKTSDKKSKQRGKLILGKEDTPRSVGGRYQPKWWIGCRV